jgi:hypothetical protein
MDIVPVASGDMTAVIYLHSNRAVVPQLGVFELLRIMAMPAAFKTEEEVLKNLQWDALTCQIIFLIGDDRLNIHFDRNQDNTMVFLTFRNNPVQRLMIHDMVLRLQQWRRRILRARHIRACRIAVAMGGHARLGMNSPILGDIVTLMHFLSLI